MYTVYIYIHVTCLYCNLHFKRQIEALTECFPIHPLTEVSLSSTFFLVQLCGLS